jgi:hypothetical protein
MDYSLASITVRIFLLDHGGVVARLSFFNDRVTITITVVIMSFADRHACSYRTSPNSNLVRKRGRRNSTDQDGNKQRLLHFHPPELLSRENASTGSFVPSEL